MKRDEAVTRLRAARRELVDSLDGVNEADMERPNAMEHWSIKDLIGHIASWDEEILRVVQAFSMQANPQYSYSISDRSDFAVWNNEQVKARDAQSLAQTMTELASSRRDLIQVVEGLTDQVLSRSKATPWGKQRTGFELLAESAEHDTDHASDILRWRKKRERWARAREKYVSKRREAKKKNSPSEEAED